MDSWMKVALRLLGFGGLTIFGLMCLVTILSPITIERAGKALIQGQVESRSTKAIEGLGRSVLEKFNRRLSVQNEAEIVRIKGILQSGLPEKVAAVVAAMQDLNCDCRKKLAESIRNSYQLQGLRLESLEPQLNAMMEGKYVEVVKKLLFDLRIFSSTNAFVFFILLSASFMKPAAVVQLFLPGILLLIATLTSAYFYLFEQNWFFTIIYNDYVGWTYVTYLSMIFLFLLDVVFNKARVTTELINQFLSVIGRAASLTPC